jgi:Subtilase family
MNLHKYAVVLKNYQDLENFYNDMETDGGSITIPDRAVDVDLRKPKSRVTHYMLTPQEALAVEKDTRVEFVELVTDELPKLMHTRSGRWARSSLNNGSDNQWGLWRHYIGENNDNFNSVMPPTGYSDAFFDVITQDIRFPYTGKNVDVIILDDQAWEPNHSEFLDDNGVSRVVDYNWWQHASAVGDSSHVGRTYAQRGTSGNFHNIHCAGTAVGRQEGWAKDANIYFLALNFGGNDVNNSIDTTLAYDYIREFHNNKPINPLTGRKNPTIVNNSWGYSTNAATLSQIQSVTYDGTTYTTPGLVGFTYNGLYGAYSATSQIVNMAGDPANSKTRFTTSGTASSVTDRMVAWPETWEKIPNQVFSFTQTDPTDNYEITVLTPCDVSQNSRIRASCNSANSYIILRRIVNNGAMISTQFNGPEIDIEITGGFGFSFFGPTGEVSIRYIVETYPADSDEIEFDVSWVVTTGERGQFFSDFNETLEMQEFNEETVSPAPDQSGNVQVLPFAAIANVSGLTASSTPTAGTNTRGYWSLNLPFSIQYLGKPYSQIHIHSGSFITLGSATIPYVIGASIPSVPKIMMGASFRRCYSIWTGTTGVTPNREFRIVWEGSENPNINDPANPKMRWEVRFFENATNTFEVTWEQNEAKTLVYDLFTPEDMRQYGYNSVGRQTARALSVEADIIDAISDGIIVVASAGNGSVPMYSSDHPYYNNYYTTTSNVNVYYHRPQTPAGAGNGTDSAVIVVGALSMQHIYTISADTDEYQEHINLGTPTKEKRADFSNFGQNVDIFAAGQNIQSAMPTISTRTKADRGGGRFYGKVSGTSMSAPQVCGIIACMLEKYPDMTQKQARELLNVISKPMQMYDKPLGTYDFADYDELGRATNTTKYHFSLEGAANKVLWFPNMRPNNKPSFPKIHKGRPASGSVYPRRQIRRRKIL